MNKLFALMILGINFIKGTLLSGIETARVILQKPQATRGGLTHISYPELSPTLASILGMMVTLTPGTTLIDIDFSRNELILHLLDLEQRNSTVESIKQDFIDPLSTLSGG